jgi:4-hydroxybenzoate polyprenyltransferase
MRALLVLGRVSNLPTVWSNCLAAWLLAGGGTWPQFGLLCLGATLLYTGGMFLNDAVDEGFDRRYRPERPIPSGQISTSTVWILAILWLVPGWAVFFVLGRMAVQLALALLVAIVLYDFVHKRTTFSPFLMAACRFLLYLLAAASARGVVSSALVWRALALAAYIIGLSYLARGESTGNRLAPWTILLLLTPIAVAFVQPLSAPLLIGTAAAVLAAWLAWCLLTRASWRIPFLPKSVAGLLAGIALVDWLAAAGHGYAIVFLGLFVLALFLQRVAPAT